MINPMTPQEDFVLRPATEADIPQIHSLIHALAEYEHALPGAVPVTPADLHEALFGPARFVEVLLASVGSQVAGYAMFFQNFSSWRGRPGIFLEDLFVRPEMRRRGIGRALLRELARIALSRNCARMEWLVLDWNQPAISFYRSLGAAPLDEWTTFRIGGPTLEALAD
jgi:GNAT superfamily N-acetyltransferase